MITKQEAVKQKFIPTSKYMKLDIEFGFTNFFNLSGSENKKTRPDSSNCIKLLEDAVFEALKLNDNIVVESSQLIHRKNFKKDFIKVKLRQIKKEDFKTSNFSILEMCQIVNMRNPAHILC